MVRQIDLLFELDDYRWKERYYLDVSGEPFRATLDRLVRARADLLARPTKLLEGEVCEAEDTAYRERHVLNVSHRYINFPELAPLIRDPERRAGVPSHVITAKFVTNSGGERMLHLGGGPIQGNINEGWQPNDRITVAEMFVQRMRVFVNRLTGALLDFQIKELLPASEVPSARIAAITTHDSGLYKIRTAAPFAATHGMQVRVLGSRGKNLTRARGLRRVQHILAPDEFTINRGPLPEKGRIEYHGGAVVAGVEYRFSKAIWVEQVGALHEVQAIPFFLRRSTRQPFNATSRLRGNGYPDKRGRKRRPQ